MEIGCGTGFVSSYVAETYNYEVYGTDYDAGQIQHANKLQPKYAHLDFQIEDATKLSFENSSFELVFSQNVFLPFVKNYGLYSIDDIKADFDAHGFKQLSHERLVYGPLSPHHIVLQSN